MWRYRRLDFPINLYKAHGSLKTKITTFPCGNYIYIFNTHGKYAQRIWGYMTIFCGKIFIFNMKCCEVKLKLLSCVRFFVTPWTIESMEFSRPEYWTGQPFPSPGDLPNPGIKPRSPTLQGGSLPAESQGKPMKWYILSLTRFYKTKNETPKTTAEEYK